MRIAVFADIHGNPFATRAVLDAISEDGVFDAVVLAGDLCYGGSDPAGCVDMVREAGVFAVYGNTDEFIFAPDKKPPDELHRSWWNEFVVNTHWAIEKLGEAQVDWLRKLPFELRFSPSDNIDDDLLVVHANPKNVHHFIRPSEELQRKSFDEVIPKMDEPSFSELMEGTRFGIMAFGHNHIAFEREWQGKRLVNVSPAGAAPIDGDLRARYTVFEWLSGEWHTNKHFIEYDYILEAAALRSSEHPKKELWAQHFD